MTSSADAPVPGEEGRQLDSYRRELTMSNAQLWLAYLALGGNATFDEVGSYLAGRTSLAMREHNTLTVALNEAFLDLGANHPIAYR
jgi:hypothetical protein